MHLEEEDRRCKSTPFVCNHTMGGGGGGSFCNILDIIYLAWPVSKKKKEKRK